MKKTLLSKWFLVVAAVAILLLLVGLRAIPIKTSAIGYCDNVPVPVRLSLIKGESIEETTKQLGETTCPSVELRLYVL